MRESISREQDRARLRALLLEGASSSPLVIVDQEYFRALRDEVGRPDPM